METAFEIGEQVHPDQLRTWEYVGLSRKPGVDKSSIRRFRKGDWILEVRALKDPYALSRVVSIRTLEKDPDLWAETRMRLMRHKQQHG
jgi:DNA-binding transcriptional MerR regulator